MGVTAPTSSIPTATAAASRCGRDGGVDFRGLLLLLRWTGTARELWGAGAGRRLARRTRAKDVHRRGGDILPLSLRFQRISTLPMMASWRSGRDCAHPRAWYKVLVRRKRRAQKWMVRIRGLSA